MIDDYSRAIAGYYLGFEPPSSLRTSLALRQGIWRKGDPHWHICGIPDVLYTDNGTDFKSRHIEQAAADLKIRLVFSTPGKPQGRDQKPIDTVLYTTSVINSPRALKWNCIGRARSSPTSQRERSAPRLA